MVEVLIALVLVGIISITMVSFVNDHHQRYRLAVAKADLTRIAESIQLAEERTGKRVTTLSEPSGGITSMLAPYLLEIPATDPWGNRFALDASKKRYIPGVVGDPYAVDVGLGRLISAGPDGEINTPIGQDPPDTENDLVVDFRRKPWITYAAGKQLAIATADGATRQAIPAVVAPAVAPNYANIAISPDASWYAAIKDNNALVVGPVDETSTAVKAVIPRPTGKQPELAALDVNGDTFPIFYPNGSSLLFISKKDLYRYDIGLDRVVPLTTDGFFGAADAASGSRTMWSNLRGSTYTFNAGSGGTYTITISTDGKIAFSHPGETGSGLYLVSASGNDAKMVKASVVSNGLLPVAWISTDTLIYMTNPSVGTDKYFYKIRMDGRDVGIALHSKPIPTGISLPVASPDGNLISFFSTDSQGALLRTDGSGFVKQTSDGLFDPFSYAAGFNSNVVPVWSRDSSTVYFVGRDGTLVRLPVPTKDSPSQTVSTIANATGSAGLQPQAVELNTDETLCGLVSSNPAGLYIVPLLGPPGARTEIRTPPLAPGEVPCVRWMDHQ